ncbi:MAG: N-acetyl-gamma-glutamyl-phosphate reductase [Acidobacteria bacterium]|nr:N-acetyl-gamma-glutamyl-phosphate reductase [Acidobacteriota bacterium]
METTAASATAKAENLRSPRVAVAGVSGYAGGELARLLLRHPGMKDAAPLFLGRAGESASDAATTIEALHPHLAGISQQGNASHAVRSFNWDRLAGSGIEILFMATPHEQSREWAPEAIARGIRVIDLSGAWRLDEDANRAIYKLHDADPALAAKLQAEAVYGCPELHRDAIRTARLIANPGCYSTSMILALAPLTRAGVVDLDRGIVCDAKSGVSGAGKAPTSKTHFMYAADNLSAYAVFNHRHTGELLEQLHLTSDQIVFTPHLLPIPRGIMATIYLKLKQKTTAAQVGELFANFYKGSPMVRLHPTPELPQIQHVVRTNFCDLGFVLAEDGHRLVIVSCLDNLLKGAAGQAVQNMNVMCGFKEEEGLL